MVEDNVYLRIRERLEERQRTLRSYHDALAVFEEPSPSESGLTLAGELLKRLSAWNAAESANIVWVNLELHVRATLGPHGGKGAHKATRMRPVAISRADVEPVVELHRELFADPAAYETKMRNEKWLTLSDVMDGFRSRHPQLPVDVFALCLETVAPRTLRASPCFANDAMAVIHQDAGKKFVLSHPKLQDPEVVDETYGHGDLRIARMVDWLRNCRTSAPVSVYLGHQRPLSETVVWAALSAQASPEAVVRIRLFTEFVHNHYLDLITACVAKGDLDTFWKATETLRVHDEYLKAAEALRIFLGLPSGTAWPWDLRDGADQHIGECLKTMCGMESCFVMPDGEPLSIMGATFLLLGAVASHVGSCQNVIQGAGVPNMPEMGRLARGTKILPAQEPVVARATAQSLFDIFRKAVWDEQNECLGLNRIDVRKGGIAIEVGIDALQTWKQERVPLVSGVNNALMKHLKYELGDQPAPGTLSTAIVNYWLRSQTRRPGTTIGDGVFFPGGGGLQISTRHGKTRVKVLACRR